MSIQTQIQSIKTKPDEKKYYTEKQAANAKADLLAKANVDISVLGRKAKSIYPKLLVFLLKLQHKGYNDYKPFPICQTSHNWRMIDRITAKKLGLTYGDLFQSITFSYKNSSRHLVRQTWEMQDIYNMGYQRDFGRILEMSEKVGVLEEVKSGYSFISASSMINAKSHSKYYVMNKKKSQSIINSILSILTISIYSSLVSTISSSIQFNSFILPIVDTFNAGHNDTLSLGTIYQQMLYKRNMTLPDEEKCVFDGQRAWSQLCNMTKDKERPEYLKKRFGGEYEEWDRSACIPNLIYTLNTGNYNDNDIDLHEKLYGQKFSSKEERDNFKTLNMMKWFGDGRSIRSMIHYAEKTVKSNNKNKTIKKSHWKILNALCEATDADRHESWKLFEVESLAYYKDMKKKAEDYLGETKKWRSNIFWHESNVHILVLNELTNRGYDVAQIYDGFYWKKGCGPSSEEMNNIYKECVLKYRSTL